MNTTPFRKIEPTNKRQDPYNLGRFRILLVEDSSFISSLMYSCLLQMGVGEIVRAMDGERAKDRIRQYNGKGSLSNIDIVILDWLMPESDGSEFLKWLRLQEKDTKKFLPVIICSAFTDAELVTQSRDLGANEVMVKPVSAEKIASRILRVIDQPRPYVQSKNFFGPDRRRQIKAFSHADRRVNQPEILVEKE